MSTDGDKATLVLKDVHEDDAGDITCELSNKKGKETATAKLKVQSEYSTNQITGILFLSFSLALSFFLSLFLCLVCLPLLGFSTLDSLINVRKTNCSAALSLSLFLFLSPSLSLSHPPKVFAVLSKKPWCFSVSCASDVRLLLRLVTAQLFLLWAFRVIRSDNRRHGETF